MFAYDCVAGPSEMIIDRISGFLVKLHDKKEFKRVLEQLIRDENLRLKIGKNARQQIQAFSISKIAEKFEKTILNAHPSN